MAKLTPKTIHDRNLLWFEALPAEEREDTLRAWQRTHETLTRFEAQAAKNPDKGKEANG